MGLTNNLGKISNTITATPSLVTITTSQITNASPIANDFAVKFIGNTTTGQSFGLQVWGGTNSSDTSFRVLNASTSTEYFKIRGDGAATFSGNLSVTSTYGFSIGDVTSVQRIQHNSGTFSLLTSGNGYANINAAQFNFSVPANTNYGNFDALTNGYAYQAYKYGGSIYGYIGQQSAFVGGASGTDLGIVSVNNLVFGAGGLNERMRITSAGDIEMQGTNSSAKFKFWRNYSTSQPGLAIYNTSGTEVFYFNGNTGGLGLVQSGNTFASGFNTVNTSGNAWGLVSGGDNNFYIGYNSSSRGYFSSSTGAYTTVSDVNKKKDFEESIIGLSAILGLKPTLFRMKDDDESAEKQLGFIAQEVKDFIPQAYTESKNGDEVFIGLQDRPIIAALVKAIQELSAKVTALESKS